MKANHTLSAIARLHGRNCSTISLEPSCGWGQRGYHAELACQKAQNSCQGNRNARPVVRWIWQQVALSPSVEWHPEQIANKLPVSHKTAYRHYAKITQLTNKTAQHAKIQASGNSLKTHSARVKTLKVDNVNDDAYPLTAVRILGVQTHFAEDGQQGELHGLVATVHPKKSGALKQALTRNWL